MSIDVLRLQIETEQRDNGRWIAGVIGMLGVLAHGKTC